MVWRFGGTGSVNRNMNRNEMRPKTGLLKCSRPKMPRCHIISVWYIANKIRFGPGINFYNQIVIPQQRIYFSRLRSSPWSCHDMPSRLPGRQRGQFQNRLFLNFGKHPADRTVQIKYPDFLLEPLPFHYTPRNVFVFPFSSEIPEWYFPPVSISRHYPLKCRIAAGSIFHFPLLYELTGTVMVFSIFYGKMESKETGRC